MYARQTSLASWWLVVAMVVLVACNPRKSVDVRAREVERRILAPCCKRQTIEDHDSDVARELRVEIDRRVSLGESGAAIEDDLARRYGEDVRAMPRGSDPRAGLGAVVAGALIAGGLGLTRFARRRRSSKPGAMIGVAGPLDLDDEDRLDDELRAID